MRDKVELKQKSKKSFNKPNNEVHVSPPRKKWVEPSSIECPILEGEHIVFYYFRLLTNLSKVQKQESFNYKYLPIAV